ncbi:MAG: helix-turn-helix domain-containing protein [Sphingomonadales bacterium]|nr:helix-turn-helix domain-containing protein [Sphingomonadales bacterium]
MANPSHSTASPDPRNPEQTSNSVRPELVEGPDGRSGFDILLRQGYGGQALSPNGILESDKHLSRRLGFRVRALRKHRRLKQEDLAGLIDRSVEAVSAIERGRTMPGYVTLARLAWALDVSPNILFDVPEDADMSPVRAGLMTGIADRLRGLDDRSLHLAHHVVDGLVAAGRTS